MRCVEKRPETPRRAPAEGVGRLQDPGILRHDVPSPAPLHGVCNSLQVGVRGVSQAAEPERCGGRLALPPALVISRRSQLVTDPAVGQEPGIAPVRKRYLLIVHRPAIKENRVAASRLQRRERVHDPCPGADEAVLGGLAELGGLERRHFDATRRHHGHGRRDLKGARRAQPRSNRDIRCHERIEAGPGVVQPVDLARNSDEIICPITLPACRQCLQVNGRLVSIAA